MGGVQFTAMNRVDYSNFRNPTVSELFFFSPLLLFPFVGFLLLVVKGTYGVFPSWERLADRGDFLGFSVSNSPDNMIIAIIDDHG